MASGTFSTRLHEVIRSRGLTKRAAAELCKINYHTLNAVLTRENAVPNAQIALQIADGLGVRFEWLVAGRSEIGAPINVAGVVEAAGRVTTRRESSAVAVLVQLPQRLLQKKVGALLVDGDVLEPFFRTGDVLFFEMGTEGFLSEQPDSRPHIVYDRLGAEWIRFVQSRPDTGILEAFELCEQNSIARKTEVLRAVPILMTVSGSLVDLIY